MKKNNIEFTVFGKSYEMPTVNTVLNLMQKFNFLYVAQKSQIEMLSENYGVWGDALRIPEEMRNPYDQDSMRDRIQFWATRWTIRELLSMGDFVVQPYQAGKHMYYFLQSPETMPDGKACCICHLWHEDSDVTLLAWLSLDEIKSPRTTFQLTPLKTVAKELWIV